MQEGASLRLLHPQRYFPHLAQRMALLEQVFNTCVGCNAYLTPPGSQVTAAVTLRCWCKARAHRLDSLLQHSVVGMTPGKIH